MSSAAPSVRRDSDRALRVVTGVGVGILLAVAVLRAAASLAHAALEIPAPDQPFTLEGASVHFAWCVRHGLPLYPEGHGPCYAVNYMGPCYFWIVGALGRLFDADIPALYVIGRMVTFACGLGPAAIAALYLRRRYGRWAALAVFIFGLGSAPMVWYGARTRPDMMADLLGAAGFFLACGRGRRWLPAAAALLAMSCLTKQSLGALWLLAAMAALLVRGDARRRAFVLGGTTAALASAIVVFLAATSEPHILPSLLGQGRMAFQPRQSLRIVMRLMDCSPELLLFALVGCALW